MDRKHYQSSMVRVVGLGMHTVRGLVTSTFWQSLVGTVSQISRFFSVHSCLGTILQTGVETSVHFLVGNGRQVSLWTIPVKEIKNLNQRFILTLFLSLNTFLLILLFFYGNSKIFQSNDHKSRLLKNCNFQ